jgi:DNA-binding transcriptional LysR family regulator
MNNSHGVRTPIDVRSLQLFARVVETRSLTSAGRALDMTTSSVSKRIAGLEERLGVRLLERTTRRVSPTAAGTEFYERCARILSELDEAELSASELGGQPRGVLRALFSAALGDVHVAALASAFAALYPDLKLDFVLSDRAVNIVEEGFDLAVRISPLRDSSLVVRRLAADRTVVCGAPSYLARRGVPRSPEELRDHDCLHLCHLTLHEEWTLRADDAPRAAVRSPRAVFNHTGALREAAIAGLGLASVPSLAVASALRSGLLVPVLEEHTDRRLTVAAVYPSGKQRSPKVSAFVDFLSRELPARLG